MRLAYRNRADAAQVLARQLWEYEDHGEVLVLGLPRGGVPVAAAIAEAIGAELDVMIVRKVGVPGREELAMGAVAMGGVRVRNPEIPMPREIFEAQAARQMEEVERRVHLLRGDRPLPEIKNRKVILVDDGLATGSTMRAAIRAVRVHEPKRVVVAVPVAPMRTVEELRQEADEVVCPFTPEGFLALGQFYRDFSQVDDDEVTRLLDRAWRRREDARSDEMEVEIGPMRLEGSLVVPVGARGIVLFAHGSGSSRKSPRNRRVARALNEGKFATLLFDLLTPQEEDLDAITREHRFDIDLLAERLAVAIDQVSSFEFTHPLQQGLFGASTGAAAALVAAARRPDAIRAVVSRGGRPDLARDALPEVQAPTLLIVGGDDAPVIELNRRAAHLMDVETRIEIVPGATHLFEEPGALEKVAVLARRWFDRHLSSPRVEQRFPPVPLGGL
jgi:putative phosphoribosyl transferase